jgi:hypothetical protein
MKARARWSDMKKISLDDKFALFDVCGRLLGQGFRRYG